MTQFLIIAGLFGLAALGYCVRQGVLRLLRNAVELSDH